MTYEKALKEIDDECRSCCGDGCKDCRTHYVRKALKKQIPKKPELWHNQPYPPEWADDDWGYRCPTCGNEDIDYPEHHCVCGQALDWGDIK